MSEDRAVFVIIIVKNPIDCYYAIMYFVINAWEIIYNRLKRNKIIRIFFAPKIIVKN